MNQILEVNNISKNQKIKIKKKTRWFKFQLFFSIFIFLVSIISASIYLYNLKKKENLSSRLINNYNLSKLYTPSNSTNNINYNIGTLEEIFGFINIPKINLYYPIFTNLTEDLLKISPCKIYGNTPDKNGNLCIAGHNYDNSLFFSNLNELIINDEIYIIDNNNNQYAYYVFKIYEVNSKDLSPIYNYDKNQKELTLITCNNFNSNRLIIKAKQKSP